MSWLKRIFAPRQTVSDSAPVLPRTPEKPATEDLSRIGALVERGLGREARAEAESLADRFPESVEINVLLGKVCLGMDDAESALDAFRLAAHYAPGDERVLNGLVAALDRLGRSSEADNALEAFLADHPGHSRARRVLADRASRAGDFVRARTLLEEVLVRDGADAAALNDLGLLVAREFGEFDRAEALLREAVCSPAVAQHTRTNLGWVLCERRNYAEGFAFLDAAIAANPDDQEARLIRSLCRLKRGDFGGWDEYEARHASPTARRRPFRFPEWEGSPLGGRLLVFGEQGLGDQIMFASCLPDALQRAPDTVVEVEPRLERLFARSLPNARIVSGPIRESVPAWLVGVEPIERQIALGSLPRLFRRSAADFPACAGYLHADPVRVAAWRERLAALGPGPWIGVSWRGGTVTSRRSLRSLDLRALGEILASVPGTWINLQYSECAGEIARLRSGCGVTLHHWQEALDDYDETAALVSALDCVVTVCTAVAHLTGALGKLGWVLVPYAAEWRYGAAGESIPWYPSLRLIRQEAPGDWEPALSRVRELLAGLPPGT